MSFRGVNPRASAVDLRRSYITGGSTTLPFSSYTFTNASDRIVWFGGVASSFSGGSLAIRDIEGKKYALIEKAITNSIVYTHTFENVWWNFANVGLGTAADGSGSDPLGGSNASLITTNSIAHVKYCRKHGPALTSASGGVMSVFVRAGSQGTVSCIRLNAAGVVYSNITPATAWARNIFYNSGVNPYPVVYNCHDGDAGTGQTLNDNHYYWCAQVELGEVYCHSPIVNNTGSPLVKAKDELVLAEATLDLNPWVRSTGFRVYLYPEHSSSDIDGDKIIASFDDSTETITVYLDNSGQINIDGSVTGSFLQTGAHTWSGDLSQQLCIECTWDNGANSVITTSGFTTGDNTYTGTQVSIADGDMATGMNHTTLDEQFDGLVSELEQL